MGWALAIGAVLLLLAMTRTIVSISRFGFKPWLQREFQVEPETWRLVGILVILAGIVGAIYRYGGIQGNGYFFGF